MPPTRQEWSASALQQLVKHKQALEIKNARQTEKLHAQNERLNEIVATQALLASADFDLAQFMQTVVDNLQRLTVAKGAVIELVEGDEMVYHAASQGFAQFVGLRLKRAGSLSGLCVQSREILTCEDCEIDPRVDRAALRENRYSLDDLRAAVRAWNSRRRPENHVAGCRGVSRRREPHLAAFGDDAGRGPGHAHPHP